MLKLKILTEHLYFTFLYSNKYLSTNFATRLMLGLSFPIVWGILLKCRKYNWNISYRWRQV